MEIIDCYGSIAFRHVLAWYHYFEEYGLCILTDEKAGYMVDHLSCETKSIYGQICAPYTLNEVITRIVENPMSNQPNPHQSIAQPAYKDELKQINIRLAESVITAFRSFCRERRITQSEGLQLLLLMQDFEKQRSLLESYQKAINAKDVEIAHLKSENNRLADLQKGNETKILHQRKAWVHIAKTVLNHVIKRTVVTQGVSFLTITPLSIKSEVGYHAFRAHPYPEGDCCHEVSITDIIRGLDQKKHSPEYCTPLFICGLTENSTLIKFRWYLQKELIGISPTARAIAIWGTSWLLGGITAKDGAVDLVCAVPLHGLNCTKPGLSNANYEIPTPENERIPDKLDRIIASAMCRATH